MTLKKHHDINEVKGYPPITYFSNEYLSSQAHSNLIIFENDDYFFPLNTENSHAISIAKSPFGSIYSHKFIDETFKKFHDEVVNELSSNDYSELTIVHPSHIYSSFAPVSKLMECGYSSLFFDINQHIVLSNDWSDRIHKMQQRKLQSLIDEGFEFKVMQKSEFKIAHQFLTVCRQTQGLQINISWDHLEKLVTMLPESYDCFGVFREGKISALCIAVRVSKDVAYYYLPATSPMFRSHSPMVLLISGMVDFYHNLQFKYLDLGVSSVQGKVQETLRVFKERMGAIETVKHTLRQVI